MLAAVPISPTLMNLAVGPNFCAFFKNNKEKL